MNYDAALMLLRHPSTMPRMKLVGPSSKGWRLQLLWISLITWWAQQLSLAAAPESQLTAVMQPSWCATSISTLTHNQHPQMLSSPIVSAADKPELPVAAGTTVTAVGWGVTKYKPNPTKPSELIPDYKKPLQQASWCRPPVCCPTARI